MTDPDRPFCALGALVALTEPARPLTRRERMRRTLLEARYRIGRAYSILRHGDDE